MDTSQAHLSSKAQVKDTSKPDNLSKDELTAVLKYGARKMSVPRFSIPSLYFLTLNS
jgi:chromodomain-helicase-DNA-binding protein 1